MQKPLGWPQFRARRAWRTVAAGIAVFAFITGFEPATIRPIEHSLPYPIHLGGATPEWSIFEGRKPHGTELRIQFDSKQNEREHTLFIRQDDVKQDWSVTLNGKRLGSLFLMEADLVHTLPIPPSTLRDGGNELQISTRRLEDILIHSLAIADEPRSGDFGAGKLSVAVLDETGSNLPARITILDTNGSLAYIHRVTDTNLVAVRPGVAYTATGTATLELLPGHYTIIPTRGPEYSLARSVIEVDATPHFEGLMLEREVNTTDWISADTHIHTFALSGHGDALLHERAITLAAEGIEMPVATEHNLHADYSDATQAHGLSKYFRVVPGNEVTTKKGHFNIFPAALDAKPPDHTIEHWPDLIGNLRESPGVQMVVLNHPTDTHSGFTPLGATNFNRVTGKNLRGDFPFTFDAMEVVNSGAMRSDWMEPFRAWFALLNRGYRIVGVGASDSHDVSRFIVGQGRTYIHSDDSEPGRIDVAAACENLKAGRAVVSLGLFTQLRIADAPDAIDAPQIASGVLPAASSGPGDLHKGSSPFFEVNGIVDFPRWINPNGKTVATLYANGRPKLVFPFEMTKRAGNALAFKTRFPKPKADTWYVLIADAPGVTNAHWSIARPYQPTSPEWNPAMIGATNPVWLDADRDGRFTPARATAERLVKETPRAELLGALAEYDWAIAAHVAELLHESGTDIQSSSFQAALMKSPLEIQQGFGDYIETISKK